MKLIPTMTIVWKDKPSSLQVLQNVLSKLYGRRKNANAATSYGVDLNWYADSGVIDHVIGELDKLTVKDNYIGRDQIYTASGSGMHIKHVGHAIIHTPYHDLKLNHILHVPQSSKNLASVHKITFDNNVFFELHPD
jgi:hypothetical protein